MESKRKEFFKNSIVLSDVSSSMNGTPMEVSIALGLMISEVTEPPFKNVIINFATNPIFHQVEGNTLMERTLNISKMPWGGNTNFQAVFDLILERAKSSLISDLDMPKRLFVLSDMQFDVADGGNGNFNTNYQVMKSKFTSAGYSIPNIVFWNLRAGTNDFPISNNEIGACLVSGFSPSLLKVLMEEGELETNQVIDLLKPPAVVDVPKIDPFIVLRKTIDDERYSILQL